MRVAFLTGCPPKKLGSIEQWTVGIAEEARRRGHGLDVFTRMPVHPSVQAEFDRLGVGVVSLAELAASPVAGSRRLAGYDLLYVNLLPLRSTPMMLCCAAWPAKIAFVDHGSVTPGQRTELRKQLASALHRALILRIDALVGVSEYVRAHDQERFNLSPARTRVIYNGVDPQRFTLQKTPNPSGALRLLFVGQLIPEKGLDVLLRALTRARAKDWTLKVVGFGRMEGPYRALVAELGLADRVELLGMRDDVHLLLQAADVLVHPATYEEAFGLTVTEGMASGCGVIATRSGGIPEIITDGEDGLLVPRGDELALAAAIDRMAFEPELRERLGAAARRTVERSFALSRCIREHVDCMEEVASGRREARRRPDYWANVASAS